MSLARLVITAVAVEGLSKSDVARDYGGSRVWVQKLVDFEFRLQSRPRWRSSLPDRAIYRPLLFTSSVPMNSGQDAAHDVPDDAADHATENDQSEVVETDASALQRSQDAIDEGWDAAREALKDTLPDEETGEETHAGQSEQDTGADAEENPRPAHPT
jgi:hypothetical protein